MKELSPITAAIEKALGFEDYKTIISLVNTVDVSKSTDFQTAFDRYYRVRRNDDWREKFYKYFESVKCNNDISFDEIIDYIYNNLNTVQGKSNPVEASFSSKMLATINPDMPILDSKVLRNMNLKIRGDKPCEKLESAKVIYRRICARYHNYICSPNSGCEDMIAVFDSYFPNCRDFSICKKVDWFLWALEWDELNQIGKFGALL